MTPTSPSDPRRRAELAKIHIAAGEIGLDDDTYRALLAEITGQRSAAALDAAGRAKVLDHLRGLQVRAATRPPRYPGRPHNLDSDPMLGKIEALLADMALPWAYADAIARRVAGVDWVAWVRRPDQLRAIIAALHAEQEARRLLAEVRALLARLGREEAYVDTLVAPSAVRRWRRQRSTLRAVVRRLTAEAGAPPEAGGQTRETRGERGEP